MGDGILNSLLSEEKNFLLQFKWPESSFKDIYFPNEFVLGPEWKRKRDRDEEGMPSRKINFLLKRSFYYSRTLLIFWLGKIFECRKDGDLRPNE